MKRLPIIGGNWKCNPDKREVVESLVGAFNEGLEGVSPEQCQVVIFPSALHAGMVRSTIKDTVDVGAQNVSKTKCGAFTGEWSSEMLKDMGCQWVLIGHSERRHMMGETIEDTVTKVERAEAAGLGIVFCIGELLEDREAGRTLEVCCAQMAPVLSKVTAWDRFVVAYEPVWAIGTGVVATKDQAQEAHQAVRDFIREKCGDTVANALRIQYGGSVTPENSPGLITQPDIDGFLVGGASLKPSFTRIIEAVLAEN